ncbi:MAG TPA: DM13 domain-containing protein [Nitrosopumilaceae archaeon]|nr:DM13 domain-containing protein [Nitrosopumilaceae archaeon]
MYERRQTNLLQKRKEIFRKKGGGALASDISVKGLTSVTLLRRTKVGATAGLVGGFAIFLTIFAIDATIDVVPGTFYKIVGIPIGLAGVAATVFGMIAHMVTAALIGAVFCFSSGLHKKLDIRNSKKGALAGGVTGVVVYAVFFIPITMFIIVPTMESNVESDQFLTILGNIESINLLDNLSLIIWGALELHIVFGIIMGIFCGMVLENEGNEKVTHRDDKKLKTLTIGIMIGTAAIGLYYGILPMYSVPTTDSQLSLGLDELQEGLTYKKFLELELVEKTSLIKMMSPRTIDLILDEAKKHNSKVNESIEELLLYTQSSELKFSQISELSAIKGNEAKGRVMIVSTGEKNFLRFEDFSISNIPDLYVYLTKSGDISSGYDVGRLKANGGDQNYDITGIDTNTYSIVIIYSKSFELYAASADLPKQFV